jgi:hypothetical protein
MTLIWREGVWTDAYMDTYVDMQGLYANACAPAPKPFPESTIIVESPQHWPDGYSVPESEPCDYIAAGPIFTVSAELRAVLDEFRVNAEFLEVKVQLRGTPYTRRTYYFANILDAVECFDYDESIYETSDLGVDEIEHLALNDAKPAGHHLFMVGPCSLGPSKAICAPIRCASEQLATRILELGLTGMVFTKPEDWRTYPAPAWRPRPITC